MDQWTFCHALLGISDAEEEDVILITFQILTNRFLKGYINKLHLINKTHIFLNPKYVSALFTAVCVWDFPDQ